MSLENEAPQLGALLRARAHQLFGRSLHIRHLDVGSSNGCDWEITALLNPVYDLQRFGMDFVASPRHADLLLVTGAVTRNLEAALWATYEATPDPKLVVAVGACACSGGVIGESYATAGGVDRRLPVDVYVPGCPPRPQAILQGLLLALDRREQKVFACQLTCASPTTANSPPSSLSSDLGG
jgi:Ni,Fe-hydrogenase III small subunit